jgi:putative SOS response-associated peptidase YedK
MCGRFVLKTPFSELVRLYNLTNTGLNLEPKYNVAPTDPVAVVRSEPGTSRSLSTMRWGLLPWWAKDLKLGVTMINAKAETIATKPAFKDAFKERRCIIPADGFYEWKKLDAKQKRPYAIVPKDGGIFSFAGLWERWKDRSNGEMVLSCSIVTTEPNELCAAIHNRMPAILPPEAWGPWLGEIGASSEELLGLLKSYPSERMRAYEVDVKVGSVKNQGAELVEPISSV